MFRATSSYLQYGLDAGDSILSINGLTQDIDSLDVFSLIDTLKAEERLAAGFDRLGFGNDYLPLMSRLDLSEDNVQYAIDYRNGFPLVSAVDTPLPH